MYLKIVANRMYQNCRVLLRTYRPRQVYFQQQKATIFTKENRLTSVHLKPPEGNSRNRIQSKYEYARRLLVDNVLKRVTNTLAADLRRKSVKQLFGGNPSPFFALVGVSLASGTGLLTKQDELEGVCYEIREAVRQMQNNLYEAEQYELEKELTVNSFEFGSVIAKGSNAVVYEAREKQKPRSSVKCRGDKDSKRFPLAIKMMFNYDAESNAMSILRSMHREMVPLRRAPDTTHQYGWEKGISERMRKLPPHPNIVAMYRSFTDYIPSLPEAWNLYPDALPARINPEGCGRNMSLFIIMKRYSMNLKQYIADKTPDVRDCILLFAQLLEAIAHMNKNEIAHRDLKSDNILLDVTEDKCPALAVTDFGCCLSDTYYGLTLPYKTGDVDKGGNVALMAPEVVLAEPGIFSTINYSKSDAWTAGALAYELFTKQNPFYFSKHENGKERRITNTTYMEDMLPSLPDNVPSVIKHLVRSLLIRNPSKRPDSELAATVCQLYLWAPNRWITSEKSPSSSEILQWLLSLTTKVLYHQQLPVIGTASSSKRRTPTEYQLIATFLMRVSFYSIERALSWIHETTV